MQTRNREEKEKVINQRKVCREEKKAQKAEEGKDAEEKVNMIESVICSVPYKYDPAIA